MMASDGTVGNYRRPKPLLAGSCQTFLSRLHLRFRYDSYALRALAIFKMTRMRRSFGVHYRGRMTQTLPANLRRRDIIILTSVVEYSSDVVRGARLFLIPMPKYYEDMWETRPGVTPFKPVALVQECHVLPFVKSREFRSENLAFNVTNTVPRCTAHIRSLKKFQYFGYGEHPVRPRRKKTGVAEAKVRSSLDRTGFFAMLVRNPRMMLALAWIHVGKEESVYYSGRRDKNAPVGTFRGAPADRLVVN
ncbi:hypothetical protein C8R47DRAFT_1078573 [Mycena vitilis]|nr:hypothetical protein C8R47DRAFT_1078573 [Mycena vitilis]